MVVWTSKDCAKFLSASWYAASTDAWYEEDYRVASEGSISWSWRTIVPGEYLPMDGLVIAEGNDLSDDILKKYGCSLPERLTGEAAKKFASDTEMDVSKDELEFALMQFALAAGVPILTFCRGSQMLNVMRGGTLIGDIESQTDSKIKHLRDSSEPDYDSFRHPISVKPKTPLAEWFADSLGQHGDPDTLMDARLNRLARWPCLDMLSALTSCRVKNTCDPLMARPRQEHHNCWTWLMYVNSVFYSLLARYGTYPGAGNAEGAAS
ncbi:GAT1_2.1 [Symbiodinium natans]|uniref:GAT1_2.1 protein n=1 Tax=Symbiodinium natans TaxID=878477 RepID=A0A812L0S7_9DINO|nr:GAT1_2.1 [Symbiodinium natans]